MCSTPFGINERFTTPGPPTFATSRCAQRLSASTNDSLPAHALDSHAALVLNAFRHQRTIHRAELRQVGRKAVVLNAFRHQRTFHFTRHARLSGRTTVLNAFRHQRTIHLVVEELLLLHKWCSTPFGINERFTRPRSGMAARGRRAQRLSASTNDSLVVGTVRLVVVRCSTPFGINERFTFRCEVPSLDPVCAQRLSASTNDSLILPRSILTQVYVLNAFRHQRTIHQRGPVGNRGNGYVLNAFRHQRTIHSATRSP